MRHISHEIKTGTLSLTTAAMLVALAGETARAGDLTPPPGAPSPTMKTLDEVEPRVPVQSLSGNASYLYVIDQPGSYYLTGNITAVSGKSGILIKAHNVTVDLSGFALLGLDELSKGISDDLGTLWKNITVKNGTIRDWGYGIYFGAVDTGRIDSVFLHSNNVQGLYWFSPEEGIVTNCVADSNSGAGFDLALASVVGSTAANNGGAGFDTVSCVVVDCVSRNNAANGIDVDWGVASNCQVHGNGASGIDGYSAVISSCTAGNNNDHGISVTRGRVSNCTAIENYGQGITTTNNSLIYGNVCATNGFSGDGAGIYASGTENRIEANNVTANDRGIDVDGIGNLILKNSTSGNTGTGSPSANYDIAAGNSYGPIVNVAGVGDISGTTGADHPWANFEY
jgi:hypothetical protein